MDSRRRLAIVAPSAYPLGGVQTWLDYLVPGLEERGWQVSVMLVHGRHSDAHRYLEVHPFKTVSRVSNPTGSREGRIRALATALQRIRPALVLGVNIVDLYDAVDRLRADQCHVRVGMTVHALESCYFQDIARWSRVIDGVVVTNRLSAAMVARYSRLPSHRVHYAPYGVPVPAFRPAESTGPVARLLFAGRFDETQKRVSDLAGILAALERRGVAFTLELAGTGPAEAALRQALSIFGDRIRFRGCLDYEAMQASFFQAGATLLVSSQWETGPLVAFEAMARGVTVVTSRFDGIGLEGSLLDGCNCLTFDVGDVEGAAHAIQRATDGNLRVELTRTAHEMVVQRYSQAASVRAWEEALERLLEAPPHPPTGGFAVSPSGRLDLLLGTARAESVRRLLAVAYHHTAPGDEWPHSYGHDDPGFMLAMRSVDDSNGALAV